MRFRTWSAAGSAALAVLLVSCADSNLLEPRFAGPSSAPQLAIEASASAILITEVMADPRVVPDNAGEWFELYNAGGEAIDLEGWIISSRNDAPHTIESSLIVPAGGYVVLGNNADRATNGGVPVDYAYPSSFVLANGSDWLAIQDPDGNTVNNVTWTRAPTAGSSRALNNPTCDNSEVHGPAWENSTTPWAGSAGDFGTPGASNGPIRPCPAEPTPLPRDVIINEVLADPAAVADASGEWFEVFNPGSTAVDLNGWRIVSRAGSGTESHVINTSVMIAPGGYVVLGINADRATNGNVGVDYRYTSINLANSSDWLKMVRPDGATSDSVEWNVTQPAGSSRALIDTYGRTASDMGSTAWVTSSTRWSGSAGDRGSPGAENPVPPSNSVTVVISDPARLPVGYTKPAFPTVRDANGAIVSPPPPLTWTSSDEGVATVDGRGYIQAVGPGEAWIRAALTDGTSGSAKITVVPGDAPTPAVYRNHLEFGIPTGGPTENHVMHKPQFSLSYNSTRGGPNWVAWNLNDTHFGSADRCNCFTADQTLPAGTYQVVDFDFRNGGYDRGHMVQSFNRTTTEQENASTFLLTNILPQAAENNQGPWEKFERYTNDLARYQNKEIYIIAGGQYSANPATLKNEGKVQIPDYTWKIAVIVERGKGLADVKSVDDLEVIAVRMPNLTTSGGPASAVGIRDHDWQRYRTTVRSIEQATGYDFLHVLPDHIERYVENGGSYEFTGFFSPVANLPTLNRVNAGQAIPVKFSLGADYGLGIMQPGFPSSAAIACNSTAPVNAVTETVSAGSSTLSYDAVTRQYTYVWKTERSWSGSCRQLVVKLNDGKEYRANFDLK